MRIARIQVVNFRCLRDLKMSFDDVTVLVGANGTGKSSVLHALAWFFEGSPLADEDISGHQIGEEVTVGVTFAGFDDADRAALGAYVVGEEATFWRTWSAEAGEKLTGKGRAYRPFVTIRAQTTATTKREAYNALRDAEPGLGLPKVRSAAAADEALGQWEREHPDDLTEARTDATHLFGFTGQARLARRFDFVLVPAVADPDMQTRDSRGTLLRQLLDRALGEQSEMRVKLAELEERVSEDLRQIMVDEGGAALDELSDRVTEQLARLVPGGEVLLAARPPSVKVPNLTVELRVADDGLETAVSRQGHGFQRALLIAVVQQLAVQATMHTKDPDGISPGGDHAGAVPPPALFLALEEPELYQHPLQARHFAATLSAITQQSGAPVQVAYATHSEHFVDPAHYERLRRFQRRRDVAWPQSVATRATVDRVVDRLRDAYRPDQVALRVKMTLRRQLSEAVFAKAVVLVEGDSDVGLLQGIADRDGGFDSLGIAVVKAHGKRQLLIPWAILGELGVPSYVVFDGDLDKADRMRAASREMSDIEAAVKQNAADNALLLTSLGVPPNPVPPTQIGDSFTVFSDTLEAETEGWAGFDVAVQAAREEHDDWRQKSEDAYRTAAGSVRADPPQVFVDLIARVRLLAP
jgi:putative ATP-dependent endonuclease of OLD family